MYLNKLGQWKANHSHHQRLQSHDWDSIIYYPHFYRKSPKLRKVKGLPQVYTV